MFHAKTIVHWKVCVESKIYFMLYNFKERRCPSVLMQMGVQTADCFMQCFIFAFSEKK